MRKKRSLSEDDELRFAVDIPKSDSEEWECVDYFYTKEEAIQFAKEKFGADENGHINLISSL